MGDEIARSFITDKNNNLYIFGYNPGCLYLQTDTLTADGLDDGFIIKLDQNGNEVWARSIGGGSFTWGLVESVYGVYDSIHDCIYVSGTFVDQVNLGGIILTTPNFNSEEIFIARMDLNGNFIWAKKGGSPGDDNALVFVDPGGNPFVAGNLKQNGSIDTISLNAGGFFASFNSNGNIRWAKTKFRGLDLEYIAGLTVKFIEKDIILSSIYLGGVTTYLDTLTLTANGYSDGLLARLDSVGNLKWIITFGGSGIDAPGNIDIDNQCNIYLPGIFTDSLTMNGLTLYNPGRGLFIAKIDSSGNVVWLKQNPVSGSNSGMVSVIVDPENNLYCTGRFSGTIEFDTIHRSTTNFNDMFIARYTNDGNCIGVINFGSAYGHQIVLDALGNPIISGGFYGTVNIGTNVFTTLRPSGTDIYIAKLDAITGITDPSKSSGNELIIYANPNQGKCTVTVPDEFLNENNLQLMIYNQTGQLIQQKELDMSEGKIKLNLEAEAKGVYMVTLGNAKKIYRGRIVFE